MNSFEQMFKDATGQSLDTSTISEGSWEALMRTGPDEGAKQKNLLEMLVQSQNLSKIQADAIKSKIDAFTSIVDTNFIEKALAAEDVAKEEGVPLPDKYKLPLGVKSAYAQYKKTIYDAELSGLDMRAKNRIFNEDLASFGGIAEPGPGGKMPVDANGKPVTGPGGTSLVTWEQAKDDGSLADRLNSVRQNGRLNVLDINQFAQAFQGLEDLGKKSQENRAATIKADADIASSKTTILIQNKISGALERAANGEGGGSVVRSLEGANNIFDPFAAGPRDNSRRASRSNIPAPDNNEPAPQPKLTNPFDSVPRSNP